jgi:hypothetical protein
MLKNHIDAIENHLLSISQIPANSGHSLHKGTPREAFIKEFLIQHLSEKVSIGSGEIIDCDSRPGQQRNQYDIVIYNKEYPKLDFGGGINAFLSESVVATLEVKSTLTEKDLTQAMIASMNSKELKKNNVKSFSSGYIPPSILNYVVAYDGPSKMETAHSWIDKIHLQESISYNEMGTTLNERIKIPSPTIDGIYVLGKGFIQFDNTPIGFISDDIRKSRPTSKWIISNTKNGSLLYLFILLLQATSNVQGRWLDPIPYLKQFNVSNILFL